VRSASVSFCWRAIAASCFAMSVAFVDLLIVVHADSTAATPASRTLTHVSALALTRSGGVTKSAVTCKVTEVVAILLCGTLIFMWVGWA
jgi:hypothetical protein